MTTVSQIITDAFRESNNIAVGQSPSTAEQTEALNLFNRFLRSLLGNEAGEKFVTINFGNRNVNTGFAFNYEAVPSSLWSPPPNSRLFFNNNNAQTVNLNPTPQDGERFSVQDMAGNFITYPVTLNGNGRTIDGVTTAVLSTNNLKREYLYRADTGDWRTVSDLQLADTFPFPTEFEDLFAIGVAMRLNPRFGTTMDPQSLEMFRRLRSIFKARYRTQTEIGSEWGLWRLTGARRNQDLYPSNPQKFNTGYPY